MRGGTSEKSAWCGVRGEVLDTNRQERDRREEHLRSAQQMRVGGNLAEMRRVQVDLPFMRVGRASTRTHAQRGKLFP